MQNHAASNWEGASIRLLVLSSCMLAGMSIFVFIHLVSYVRCSLVIFGCMCFSLDVLVLRYCRKFIRTFIILFICVITCEISIHHCLLSAFVLRCVLSKIRMNFLSYGIPLISIIL